MDENNQVGKRSQALSLREEEQSMTSHDLLREIRHNNHPWGAHNFKRVPGSKVDKPHYHSEKTITGNRTETSHNQPLVREVPRSHIICHPKAILGPDKLINHNYYWCQCQSTCSCHKTLVIAKNDESQDVEHAKNINLQVKMILIGFRPWSHVRGLLSIRLVQSAKQTPAFQIETVIGWQRLIEMLGNK